MAHAPAGVACLRGRRINRATLLARLCSLSDHQMLRVRASLKAVAPVVDLD